MTPEGTVAGGRARGASALLAVLLLTGGAGGAAAGCGAGEGSARQAAVTETHPDTLVLAALGPAGGPGPSGSPRLSSQEQVRRPVALPELGFADGSPDAPVKVVEFSDFGCGYCRRFHAETYPALQEEFVKTGKVQWRFIPYVLGAFPNGLEAALAAECAGEQGRFAGLKDRIFAEQGAWRASSDPYALFGELAEGEGLDAQRFTSCLRNGWREARVRQSVRMGREMGVGGTPTFFVEGQPIQGAVALPAFREFLRAVVELKGGGGGSP